MKFPAVYLASRSPRRRELLNQIAVDFTLINPDINESVHTNEQPEAYVKRIAIEKARAGLNMLSSQDRKPVLAADTAVVIGQEIFGKPVNDDDARRMLKILSADTHRVITAVALASGSKLLTAMSISEVTFAPISDSDIEWYIKTREGIDKAGCYAVQGLGAIFIEHISGSYSGIMGLPIRETAQLLKQIERKPTDFS